MSPVTGPTHMPAPNGSGEPLHAISPPVRQSGRVRKAPAYDKDGHEDELTKSPTTAPKKKVIKLTHTWRDTSRKTASADPASNVLDRGVKEAVVPLEDKELEGWHSWTEVESEPSFFNTMLKELGVKEVKVQELFSVDQDSLHLLPQPVHGLIFLYQYEEEDRKIEQQGQSDHVWFANQTTENACATVAMLNIIMNCQSISLGAELGDFKANTRDLPPPLRGYILSTNRFVRSIHNSFSRRPDLLNADLCLENAFDESKKKRRMSFLRRRSKKKFDDEAAYHFIAYVPVGGQVWELDGLESQPICIGDWTRVAQPVIATRMLGLGENLTFNLLAMCRNPLARVRQDLASNIRQISALNERMSAHSDWDKVAGAPRAWMDRGDETELATFELTEADIAKELLPESLSARPGDLNVPFEEAKALHESLELKQKQICSEYKSELLSRGEDEIRVEGRKQDWTSGTLGWVRKLAQYGMLHRSVDEN